MYEFSNPRGVEEFVSGAIEDARHEHDNTTSYYSLCRLYDLGIQWVSQRMSQPGSSRFERVVRNYAPTAGPIRAVVNRITRYVRQINATTNPHRLDVDAVPGDRSSGVFDTHAADLLESAANALIDDCGMVSAARGANIERTICGDHGVGLWMERRPVSLSMPDGGVVGANSWRLRCFDFDAARLTLDPHVSARDLRHHEYVVYSDVWTIHRMRRTFSERQLAPIDPSKLRSVGDLMPSEMSFNRLSGGTLYAQYARHSKTPGAIVRQVFVRGPGRRFDRMYLVIDHGGGNSVVNFDSPENPFGGDGLPFIVLRGYPRTYGGGRHSISDVMMMRDDQDKMNLLFSIYFQQLYNYTQYKWLAHKAWFGSTRADDGEIAGKFRQSVVLSDRGADPNLPPPNLVQMPAPNQGLDAAARMFAEDVRDQVSRSEIHQGRLKTHQTNQGLRMAVELSELPLDDRIASDVEQYERLIAVLLSTGLRGLRDGSPDIARLLVRAGFDASDLGLLAGVDPDAPPVTLRLQNQAIRNRSRESRRQEVFDLAATGGITGEDVRRILSGDLDMPVSDLDKQATRWARVMAMRVVSGAEWVPMPVGRYGMVLVEEFTRALTDRRSERVPGAVERLARAIAAQQQHDAAMAAGMAAGPAAPEPTGLETVGIDDLAESLGDVQPVTA